MTKEEVCKIAIERGFTYNPKTGDVLNSKGKKVTCTNKKGYIQVSVKINNKTYIIKAHRFAWYYTFGVFPTHQIDHINCIKIDNRLTNLRDIPQQENTFNRKTTKGYNLHRGKYKAQIMVNGESIYLGYFKTEEEARAAYLAAKEKYHIINGTN